MEENSGNGKTTHGRVPCLSQSHPVDGFGVRDEAWTIRVSVNESHQSIDRY